MFDAKVPAQTTRKSRCRSAATAVPVVSGRSPSTRASVASSALGVWSRRNEHGRPRLRGGRRASPMRRWRHAFGERRTPGARARCGAARRRTSRGRPRRRRRRPRPSSASGRRAARRPCRRRRPRWRSSACGAGRPGGRACPRWPGRCAPTGPRPAARRGSARSSRVRRFTGVRRGSPVLRPGHLEHPAAPHADAEAGQSGDGPVEHVAREPPGFLVVRASGSTVRGRRSCRAPRGGDPIPASLAPARRCVARRMPLARPTGFVRVPTSGWEPAGMRRSVRVVMAFVVVCSRPRHSTDRRHARREHRGQGGRVYLDGRLLHELPLGRSVTSRPAGRGSRDRAISP